MTLKISGKNLDLGESLRAHADERITATVAKYFSGGFSGQLVLTREGSGFHCECTIHLDSGADLHLEASANDPLPAFDKAADRLDKRLRRYKERLKKHPSGRDQDLVDATAYVIAAPDDEAGHEAAEENPVIIAEAPASLRTLTVGSAVVELDLANVPVLVFRHAVHGGINVVYRRRDGNIGWIDPSLPAGRDASNG